MRQERGLDRLEQLQRRARDQQHVEHDPRQRAVGRGRVDGQHGRVQERLLGEHDPRHPYREAAAAAQREVVVRGGLLHALGTRPGERGVGLVDGDRRDEGRLVTAARLLGSARALGARACERRRHDDKRDERGRGDPQRDRRLSAGDADRDGEREADARDRLHQHQPAEQPEALVPGQPSPREVARGIGERADDEHDVQVFLVFEDVVDQSVVQRQRDDQEDQRECPLDQNRHAHRVLGVAACPAPRDRAREQLFDRPVDHRDDHEHDRPQQVDPLGRLLAEHVACDREVRECQQPGRGDADREDARSAAVRSLAAAGRRGRCGRAGTCDGFSGGARGLLRGAKGGQATSSRGTASATRRPRRSEPAGGRTNAWTSG